MSSDSPFHPEHLRPADYICSPDPRSFGFVMIDREIGGWRHLDVTDYHQRVAIYNLKSDVPEEIKIHFDTARNLYLHAWYVYRFYPVAEHHALACLELALRLRYENEIPKKYYKHSKFATLAPLLRYAVDKGDIKNEGFKHWHEAVETRARSRYEYEKLDEMRQGGVEEMELDYSEVQITDIDRNIDFIKDLIENLPKLRNNYAHGSKLLHNQILGTIQVVSEIINQIYPVRSDDVTPAK